MISNPKISVIIPIYNVASYLDECLNSVADQTFRDIEIIAVNDGSTDNSLDIIEAHRKKDNRIIIINKQNEGVMLARKSGVEIAAGEYIYYLDGDDYMESDALDAMYCKAKETNADIVVGDYSKNYRDKIQGVKLDTFTTVGQVDFIKLQLKWLTFFLWNKLVKRKLYKDIYFPGEIGYGDDIVILSQLLTKAKIISKVNHNIVFYRIRNNGLTNKISEKSLNSIFNAYLFNKNNLSSQSYFESIREDFDIYSCKRLCIYFYKGGRIAPYEDEIKSVLSLRHKITRTLSGAQYLFWSIARINVPLAIFLLRATRKIRYYLPK